jgi:sRNA-binding protein
MKQLKKLTKHPLFVLASLKVALKAISALVLISRKDWIRVKMKYSISLIISAEYLIN